MMQSLKELLVKVPLIRAWVEAGLSKKPVRTRLWSYQELVRRFFLAQSKRCDTVLLSYPRSGNHLVRFVVESCSHRPTLGHADSEAFLVPRQLTDDPIFLRTDGVWIKDHRPILLKRHNLDIDCKRLIFLTRNPITSILSQHGRSGLEIDREVLDEQVSVFIRNLNEFLGFDESNRLLISLEEIEKNPVAELSKVLVFLGVQGFETELKALALDLGKGREVLQRQARPDLSSNFVNLLPNSYQYLKKKFRNLEDSLKTAGLNYEF